MSTLSSLSPRPMVVSSMICFLLLLQQIVVVESFTLLAPTTGTARVQGRRHLNNIVKAWYQADDNHNTVVVADTEGITAAAAAASSSRSTMTTEPTITRLYTGADGLSHVEKVPLAPHMHPFVDDEGSHGHAMEPLPCKDMTFRVAPAGYAHSWHNAPRPQYVMILQGEMQITLRNGDVHTLCTGDVVLAEDMTGTGHQTQMLGDTPTFYVVMPVDNDEATQKTTEEEGANRLTVKTRSSSKKKKRTALLHFMKKKHLQVQKLLC